MGSGKKAPPSRKPKKRSAAQKLSSARNTFGNKENIVPDSTTIPALTKAARQPKDYKREFQNSQRKLRHARDYQKKLHAALDAFKSKDASSVKAAALAKHREVELQATLDKVLSERVQTAGKAKGTLKVLRAKVKSLQQRVKRAAGTLSRSIARAKTGGLLSRVTEKGIYTIHARKLARIMVDSGCARGKVGTLMERIGQIFGVHINRKMSRRTVSRAIAEGGIAAKMQATFELSLNKGVTISADSTSNRGQNIESRHITMRAPDYKSGSLEIDRNSTPKVRFLGVEKTLDHTSAESIKGWNEHVRECIQLFNDSPLAARLQKKYTFREFLKILKGMHGDHASNEKSTAKGYQTLKLEDTIRELGEQALAGKSVMDLVLYLSTWNAKKIAEAGGIEAWDLLSSAEQAERDAKLMQEIVTALGKDAYNALSPEDRRAVDLFIWGGCCMHKDLNSFKGGNTEMMLEWAKLGVPGPILLANKQNAAILRNLFDPAVPADAAMTEDELRAFQTSTCGGVKTCALAGAIFNNKDDKKGQADKHVDFMTRKLDTPHPRFPDTSNTRFGSYGGASAELITYLLQYLDLMDVIQWSKINPSLTNIEKNLRDALKDEATLTELCAMILYQQIISHPYLRQVRGPGTENVNLLDLGPLHVAVRDHIQQILDNPDIIFGGDLPYETAALDGKEWKDQKAVDAVKKLMSSLPHLQAITMAFFRGALATWCSATEKQLAWMPSTNDANEGALGSYRVAVRGKPSLTLHQYNSLAMYRRNDTQDFMDAVLTDEDHAFIMREARRVDASGAEALRRQEIVDFRIKTAEMHKEKALAAARKAIQIRRELRRLPIVSRTQILSELTIPKIHLQLNALRLRGVPDILPNSRYTRKPAKVDALEAALRLYYANRDNYPLPNDPEADKDPDVLTVVLDIVDDWVAEEDAEMEE
ncbi:hypothetical protein B0H13DRAFT_1624250 [Mycena leptocephala]|nr:hypothetical protein B0H13DRAFT_1624250 [Mycena leptocephala]